MHLAQPLAARLGATSVTLVDLSTLGARAEHHVPLLAGGHSRLAFTVDGEQLIIDCRIVRSRIERFSVGTDGVIVYHSGVEFENVTPEMKGRLKYLLSQFITRALEEQKLNARGMMPAHDQARMPIFRYGGQLTADGKHKPKAVLDNGYICLQLENAQWRRKRTHDPGQPLDGFTISANEESSQVDLLCDAYIRSDRPGRTFIQLCAQLSLIEGEGVEPGRFEP
ncbi:MAG TPA: hypothetical protein VFN10_06620 [Thermoanaerobaculia bacterium]|nr:hypothetical protein [Thermoanaerobaculia bacterium]